MNDERRTSADMRTPDRPLPRPDPVSSEYWAACGRGELLIQRCPTCGHLQFYPRALCTSCGETPDWLKASGRGTVHTFTVIRQNYAKPFRDLVPYVVAMVQLEEGPLIMGNITGCDVDGVDIGMPVEVWFESAASDESDGSAESVGSLGDDVAVPYWRPRPQQ